MMYSIYLFILANLMIYVNGGILIPNSRFESSLITTVPSSVSVPANPSSTPQFKVLAFAGPVRRYTTKIISAPEFARSAPGFEIEGRYIPDNTEKLYDDGSYKPEYSEKLYDDGSYKGEKIYWYKGKRIYW